MKIINDENSLKSFSPKLPVPVAVGLLNGSTQVGILLAFSEDNELLTLESSVRRSSGETSALQTKINKNALAYLGFRKNQDASSFPRPANLQSYGIHLTGKRTFNVLIEPSSVMDPAGFYGWPNSESDLFHQYYFFGHAVTSRENKEPIGSLLVKDGVIAPEELDKGLEKQFTNQNAPLGQILVENKVLDLGKVAKAAADQAVRAKQGRPMRLGEVLVEAGLATDEDITTALKEQKKRRGKRLGEVLVELGIVTENDVAQTLAKKFHLPFVDLDAAELNTDALSEIPAKMVEKYRVFPFQTDSATISVAISDPLAMEPLDMLRFSISKQIREAMVTPSQLEKYISTYLSTDEQGRSEDQMTNILAELHTGEGEGRTGLSGSSPEFIEAGEDDSAIAKLVNRFIVDAYRKGVSDIHVEPYGTTSDMVIRFRLDGVCSVYQTIPSPLRNRVVARIKIMADLDITERRKPQDGKIRFLMAKKMVELRVATIPTVNGNEDVVLRILAGAGAMPLEAMSFNETNLANLRAVVRRPYGLILCVGPTGSGKTTTLHAMVGHINEDSRKIWTAEDPVEITQHGLRQVQVKPKIGFTFAAAMRAFLRADPDVILVGEMRDKETAAIGVEASLTGHLVLSTLHTNSAAETITRLIDMGLDAFSFADALLGVLAQRLARKLCSECKEQYQATEAEYKELAHYYGADELVARLEGKPLLLWRAPGCRSCEDNGYKGRVGIHEFLVINDELRAAIQHSATVDEIVAIGRKNGMKTLLHDGLEKSINGATDVKQVLSVCSR